jgi:hypothetical protein
MVTRTASLPMTGRTARRSARSGRASAASCIA